MSRHRWAGAPLHDPTWLSFPQPAPCNPTVRNPDSRPYPDNRLQPLVGLGQVRHPRPREGRRAVSLCASCARGFCTCLPEAHGLATAQHGPVHRPLTPHPQCLAPGEPLPLPVTPSASPPCFLSPNTSPSCVSRGPSLPQACPGPMPRWNPSGL